jgi:hypothetical protein
MQRKKMGSMVLRNSGKYMQSLFKSLPMGRKFVQTHRPGSTPPFTATAAVSVTTAVTTAPSVTTATASVTTTVSIAPSVTTFTGARPTHSDVLRRRVSNKNDVFRKLRRKTLQSLRLRRLRGVSHKRRHVVDIQNFTHGVEHCRHRASDTTELVITRLLIVWNRADGASLAR